ncbi:ADP-dependent glucokinase [Procambarus clarkii]|uniref:ADP-dependent glucokinase n=1 Tax=Procambarus clarkii TaxID=6728 RepID=UPI001E671BE6|nr:ADP-dependent glucokinase-like [Procambarus clarkii]
MLAWSVRTVTRAAMETGTVLSTVLSIVVIFAAFWYSGDDDGHAMLHKRLQHVLHAMLEVEEQHSVGEVRIAVGYGACKDVFVQGSDLMGIMTPPQRTAHFNRIDSIKQLKEMYALFYTAGSAAERYVGNETLFSEILAAAEAVSESYSALGGNAPVMASRFAFEGAKVLLAAKRSPYIMEKVHPSIVVGGVETDGDDDIHLILEYKAGERWGSYQAPRANRFIMHSDDSNPTLSTVEYFGEQLEAFKPHLFVVGGLQMMDNFPFPPGVREDRLLAVRDQMTSLPTSTRVHFEMASFTELDLLNGLIQHIIPYADSLGMNEQELPNLYSMMKYRNVSLVSDFNPRVAVVLDQMREVFQLLRATPEMGGRRRLTRLHLHTLAYQTIMVWKDSQWTNTRAAATKAALTANRHVCGNPKINLEHARMLMDEGFTLSEAEGAGRVLFDTQQPVSCWTEYDGKVEVCIAPVLICTSVRQTAGGGDNISAAGLVLQV